MIDRRRLLTAVALTTAPTAGCLRRYDPPAAGAEPSATAPPQGPYWYHHPDPGGNRLVGGRAVLRKADPVRIQTERRPRWIVAHPATDGAYWTVLEEGGRATRWHVSDGNATRSGWRAQHRPSGPPVIAGEGKEAPLLDRPGAMASAAGQVVVQTDAGPPRRVFIDTAGGLVIDGSDRHRIALGAPPDARPVVAPDGRIVVHGDATDRYRHGALGDDIEPATLVVVDPVAAAVDARVTLEEPQVFEALQPLVADLDGDGTPEVIATVATADEGARIAAFTLDGRRVATGPAFGPGWRHQLAVGPLGPAGEPELAVVLKPHVDRILEYYRLDGDRLTVVATAPGYASHTYGSRILGGGIAADIDGDGGAELLVPTADRRHLAVLGRRPSGVEALATHTLGSPLSGNLSGVSLPGGGLTVGAATREGVLIWSG